MFNEQDEKSLEQDLNSNEKTDEENVQINVVPKKKSFNDFKIRYKKDKKKYLVALSALCAMLAMTMGSSYAYLTYVSKTDNTVVLDAGTLALTFRNEQNVISLENAVPVKDQVGLEQEQEYSFDIKNNGTIPAIYTITLNNICETGNEVDTCIPDEYIKVGIKAGDADYKVIERNEKDKYIIATGSLDANESDKYKMKVWLDHTTPNTYNAQNNQKIFYKGKLGLTYEQGKSKPKPQANYVYRYGTNVVSLGDTITGFDYTEDYTTLNKTYFLGHKIGNDGKVERNDACFIKDNTLYCLKGVETANVGYSTENPAPYYQENYNTLLEAFGPNAIENNVCSVHEDDIGCSASSLNAYAAMYGYVNAYGDSTVCDATNDGNSECSE